jgi:hypothetical protein
MRLRGDVPDLKARAALHAGSVFEDVCAESAGGTASARSSSTSAGATSATPSSTATASTNTGPGDDPESLKDRPDVGRDRGDGVLNAPECVDDRPHLNIGIAIAVASVVEVHLKDVGGYSAHQPASMV